MTILVPIGRRKGAVIKAEWRDSAAQDGESYAYRNFNGLGSSALLLRCPHGVSLSTEPEPDFYGEGEIQGWISLDCTACRWKWVQYRPKTGIGHRKDVFQLSPRFERKGYRKIDFKARWDEYLGDEFLCLPDHYVSPYDPFHRLQGRQETRGGYVLSGRFGGIGVRAKMGFAPQEGDSPQFHKTARSVSEWRSEHEASFLPSLDETDDSGEFSAEFTSARLCTVPMPRPDDPDSWRKIEHYRAKLVVVHREIPEYSGGGLVEPGVVPSIRVAVTKEPKLATPDHAGCFRWWDDEAEKLRAKPFRNDSQATVGHARTAYVAWCAHIGVTPVAPRPKNSINFTVPSSVRKPWADGWRTERKMRDLAARLDMYRYADGAVQPVKMMQAAWLNLAAAQYCHDSDYKLTGPERPCWGEWAVKNRDWPTQEQHGSISYRETAPLPVPSS